MAINSLNIVSKLVSCATIGIIGYNVHQSSKNSALALTQQQSADNYLKLMDKTMYSEGVSPFISNIKNWFANFKLSDNSDYLLNAKNYICELAGNIGGYFVPILSSIALMFGAKFTNKTVPNPEISALTKKIANITDANEIAKLQNALSKLPKDVSMKVLTKPSKFLLVSALTALVIYGADKILKNIFNSDK